MYMSFVRAAALLAVLGFPLLSAGCSGGGGATPPVPLPQTNQDQTSPAAPLDGGISNAGSGVTSSAGTGTTVMATATPAPALTTATTQSLTIGVTSSGVRTHVMTAGLFWGYAGTPTTVPLSAAQTWLNWAMTSGSYASTLRTAGIKVDVYKNFWRNATTDNPKTDYYDLAPGGAHAPAEAKNCGGAPLYSSAYGRTYESDARSPYTLGHARLVVGTQTNADAVFSDDTGAISGMVPCNFSLSTYQAATNAIDARIPYKLFLNTLGAGNPVAQVGYTTASNVLGAMCEACITKNPSTGDVPVLNAGWADTENAEIRMIAIHKIYWLYARASGPATEYQLRNFTIASFLLAYDPNYAMLEEALRTPSGFEVFPEAGLVPMNPLTTATSVGGYLKSNGTYMREFGACYYRGTLRSKCAVVVNPTSYTKTLPTTAYGHAMVLSGYGVRDGGTVSFSGGRPSLLPAGSGVILFP